MNLSDPLPSTVYFFLLTLHIFWIYILGFDILEIFLCFHLEILVLEPPKDLY